MKAALQRGLLGLYRIALGTRVLETRIGRRTFVRLYQVYKDHLEAGRIDLLRRWVDPRSTVIDVGANIGYFTLRFAAWLGESGRVIALEPEPGNYAELVRAVKRADREGRVEALPLAVAESCGPGFLELHGWHPGDHRLGPTGVPVQVTTLDELLRERGWPAVSLIKIDVQGGEGRVLAGACESLRRLRPVLFIEVDEAALRRSGSDARVLLQNCQESGYAIHGLETDDLSPPLTPSQALASIAPRGYRDFLFLPRSHQARTTIGRCHAP